VDGLETAKEMDQNTRGQLHNLLAMGPSCKIWPIVTANAEHLDYARPYLSLLETRLLCLSKDVPSIYECKYLMKENSRWLKFSLFP
jgi:hypothetical protein